MAKIAKPSLANRRRAARPPPPVVNSSAHQWLVAHASCSSAGRPAAYDSDDPDATLDPPPCPCTYHPTLIEARETK